MRAVMRDPLRPVASTMTVPWQIPEMTRLRTGKFAASGGVPGGNSLNTNPCCSIDRTSRSLQRASALVARGDDATIIAIVPAVEVHRALLRRIAATVANSRGVVADVAEEVSAPGLFDVAALGWVLLPAGGYEVDGGPAG